MSQNSLLNMNLGLDWGLFNGFFNMLWLFFDVFCMLVHTVSNIKIWFLWTSSWVFSPCFFPLDFHWKSWVFVLPDASWIKVDGSCPPPPGVFLRSWFSWMHGIKSRWWFQRMFLCLLLPYGKLTFLGGGNSNIFWCSPRNLGKIPILH